MLIPDEVRISLAEKELFNSVASIITKYEISQSMIALLMKSVLLDIVQGELRVVSASNMGFASELMRSGDQSSEGGE